MLERGAKKERKNGERCVCFPEDVFVLFFFRKHCKTCSEARKEKRIELKKKWK
jgi:hypothetical protein